MTHPYRCTHRRCRKRVTLLHPLEWYRRPPTCPDCGLPLTGKKETSMRARDKKRRCDCDGYHFPHSKGSKWCRHNAKPLTDRDYEERYKNNHPIAA